MGQKSRSRNQHSTDGEEERHEIEEIISDNLGLLASDSPRVQEELVGITRPKSRTIERRIDSKKGMITIDSPWVNGEIVEFR